MRTRLLAALSSSLIVVLALAAGAAATPTGQLYSWGYNGYGELGNGNVEEGETPALAAGLSSVVSVAGSEYQTLALLSNGTVEASGYNAYGELGDGTTEEHKSFELIPGLSNVVAVSGGYEFSLALLANGTVEAWGINEYGQLGDGTHEQHKSPHLIPGLQNVVAISAGNYFSLALLSNGTVEAWGWNGYGELGVGSAEEQKSPVPVPGISGVVGISANGYASLDLLSNGTVKAAGYNHYGELGDGTKEERRSPVTVPGLIGVTKVSGGEYYGEALLADGTVKSWGDNEYGELGNGTHGTPQLSPGAVQGLSGVQSIAGNGYFTLASLASGPLDGWGYNGDYELGEGVNTERDAPVTVPGVSNVVAAATSAYSYTAHVVEGAVAALSGSSLSFPSEGIGTASPAQTVVLTNTGPAQLTVAGEVLTGSGAGSFNVVADGCHGVTLGVGGTCSISLVFTPSGLGGVSATLAISSTAANTLPMVALSGTGVAPPVVSRPPLPVLLAPRLGALSLSSHSFRAAGSGPSALAATAATGTVVSYSDTEAATTTFTVQRALAGRTRSARSKACAKAPRHPVTGSKHCTYYATLGSFTHTDTVGADTLRFSGRVAGRKLKAGSYRLLAVASSSGGRSAQQTASFKIVKH